MPADTKPIMVVGTSAAQRREIVRHHFESVYEMAFISPDIDEKALRADDPYALTKCIAEAKMAAVLEAVVVDSALTECIQQRPGSVAISFDQVVVWKNEVREKPSSKEESRSFIQCYSDSNLATVQTTVLYDFASRKQLYEHNQTMTYYSMLSAELVERVVERGVCMHTAGGFVVEDEDMKSCMVKIDPGDEEEVMGVSSTAITNMLRQIGSIA